MVFLLALSPILWLIVSLGFLKRCPGRIRYMTGPFAVQGVIHINKN